MKKSPCNGAWALRVPDAGRYPGCNIVQWRVYWVAGETPATEVRMFCSGAWVLTVIQVAVLVGGSIIELLVKNTNNGGKIGKPVTNEA